ncbi:hypothetical protein [Plantactinospora soyae]|uniref:Uncharacterized protein n=1 Tax=Plantactinospora soyae TaxID=1544732 RepID=A0A927QUX6_9ACTN|nr:hypothetical protein [Plantactinospora soyae]MBE1485070.1 hypothetical protein [Plantactinospora soyae]
MVKALLLGGVVAIAAGGLGFGLGKLPLWIFPADDGSEWGLLPLALAGVAAGLTLLGTVLLTTFIVRAAAWLQGTRLTVRGLRTRTVDLADARSIEMRQLQRREVSPVPASDVVAKAPPVTALLVSDDRAAVRLRFLSGEAMELPPEQLLLLAEAVSTARCPGAGEAVAWLRSAAADVQQRKEE